MESLKRVPLSKAAQVEIFRRDHWLCRYCLRPVVFAPAMRLLEREVRRAGYTGPMAYYHAHATRDGAPLLDELWAVLDHANAHARGGQNDDANLVTARNKCNGRKSDQPLPEWDLRDKDKPIKGRYGEPEYWDGLSQVFVVLAQRDESDLTATERQWLKALLE
jgi:5-methylcytosine-specific restriction endonuclease McrA